MRQTLFQLIFAGILITGFAKAQSAHPDLEQAMLELKLDEAEKLSAQTDALHQRYYLTKIAFARYLCLQDPALLPTLESTFEKSLETLNEFPKDGPLVQVMRAELYFQRGMVRFLNQEYFSCATDLQESCSIIDQTRNAYPTNVEQLKLSGAFHIALASAPSKFRWITRLLCFRGDLETGRRELAIASKHSRLLPSEAEIILFYTEKNVLDQPQKATARMKKLHAEKPNQPVWTYFLATSYLDERKSGEALQLLQQGEELRKKEEICFPWIWEYMRGKALYFQQDYKGAVMAFGQFLQNQKGPTFRADALFRSGIALSLSDEDAQAKKVFQDLVRQGSSGLDADAYALHKAKIFASRPLSEVEKGLFAARNTFDGGNYQESLSELKKLEPGLNQMSGENQTEFYYRQGRNFQVTGQLETAKMAYENCLALEVEENRWMQAYAVYNLGIIAQEQGQAKIARKRFKEALEFEDYYYQGGLEQRCKAALSQR